MRSTIGGFVCENKLNETLNYGMHMGALINSLTKVADGVKQHMTLQHHCQHSCIQSYLYIHSVFHNKLYIITVISLVYMSMHCYSNITSMSMHCYSNITSMSMHSNWCIYSYIYAFGCVATVYF